MSKPATQPGKVESFPVLYDFGQIVAGQGFFAEILISGRALFEVDGDEAVFMGVEPAGFAGCGADRGEAYSQFKEGLRAILFDMADEAEAYEAFEADVQAFFAEDNGELEPLWAAAVASVQSGETEVTWAKAVTEFPPRGVKVRRAVVPKPGMNHVDSPPSIPIRNAA